jgi:hypothetical protein
MLGRVFHLWRAFLLEHYLCSTSLWCEMPKS